MSLLYLFFLLLVGYLLVRYVYTHHPTVLEPVNLLVKHGLIEPVQEVLHVSGLGDVLRQRPKRPNRYGYGGMDPSGKERKGGDGSRIPEEVEVGWWNGEISYPERHLSPVQDTDTLPQPQIADIGWWGDDWIAQ